MERGLRLKKSQYIARIVEKFRQQNAHPVRNPCVIGQDLTPNEENKGIVNSKIYRELIGSLFYLANATRPDICVPVSSLSQYLDKPTEIHWRAAIRVLRYLKGTANFALKYRRSDDDSCHLAGFCDSNWGGDLASHRSTSDVLVKMCGRPVVFKNKKQATVALASAEAEYVALALATQEILWVRQLLQEMSMVSQAATPVSIDNPSAISMAANCGYTPRTKHIDLRFHFLRDHVELKNIELHYVQSAKKSQTT